MPHPRSVLVPGIVAASLLLIAPTLAAQGRSAGDSTSVPASARAAIDSVNAAWLPALQRRDGAAIAEAYADDGVLVAANGETTRGRAAIEQVMARRRGGQGPCSAAAWCRTGSPAPAR